MIAPFVCLLLVAGLLFSGDSFMRLVLAFHSRRFRHASGEIVSQWLVIVPARSEGENVRPTLQSVAGARGVRTLVVLDGPDPAAAELARQLHAASVVKEPPGPTKGAALGWLARTHAAEITKSEAVLVLDVGSTVSEGFFENFRWPDDAAAVQTMIRGEGAGAGKAAATSERVTQTVEDRGREAWGWSARFRGTGMAFRPAVFIDVAQRLVSQAEDQEASLLLMTRRERVRLAAPESYVLDQKPDTIHSAASQRARWLIGQYALLWQQRRAFGVAFRRAPAEAFAFVLELFGRPLMLTFPIRLAAALAASMVLSSPFIWIPVAVIVTSLAADVSFFIIAGRARPDAVLRLTVAWWFALLLLPRAIVRWMRVKRL